MVELAVYFMEALVITAPPTPTVQTFIHGRLPALLNCLSSWYVQITHMDDNY